MKKLFLAISVLIGFALSTQAQNIGVQFWTSNPAVGNNGPLTSTQVAGVVPQDNFNTIDVNPYGTGTVPLVDSSGAPISATFTLIDNNDGFFTGTGTSTPNETLLSGQSGSYSSPIPVFYTFNGLQAGTYDLIVYTVTNVTGDNAEFLLKGTTAGPADLFDIEQNGAAFDGTFIQGSATNLRTATTANYIEFTGVTPSSGSIGVSLPNQGFLYVDGVAGIQLIETPEPPAVLLMAGAALVLLGVAWKNRAACRA